MSDPSHKYSVQGNLVEQAQMDIIVRLAQQDKNIFEIKDLINNLIITQDKNFHKSRSRHGEGSYKSIIHHSPPQSNKNYSRHHNTNYY